jgi:hypothetical protein
MDRSIRTAADRTVKIGFLLASIGYLLFAGFLIWAALWLVRVAAGHWIAIAFAAFLVYDAYCALLKSAEKYLHARPAERQDEKVRRLEANGLYVPQSRRREERPSRHNARSRE